MTRKKFVVPMAAVLVSMIAAVCLLVPKAKSRELGDRVGDTAKNAAAFVLTEALADELNNFINTTTLNNKVPDTADTKVVPIITVGKDGAQVGAAQISGPKELVQKVKAVMHIEAKPPRREFAVDVFIPTESINPLKYERVSGIGISSIIAFRQSK